MIKRLSHFLQQLLTVVWIKLTVESEALTCEAHHSGCKMILQSVVNSVRSQLIQVHQHTALFFCGCFSAPPRPFNYWHLYISVMFISCSKNMHKKKVKLFFVGIISQETSSSAVTDNTLICQRNQGKLFSATLRQLLQEVTSLQELNTLNTVTETVWRFTGL